MQFYQRHSDSGGAFDLFGVGIDEQRHRYRSLTQGATVIHQVLHLAHQIQPTFRRELLPFLGNETTFRGANAAGNGPHLVRGSHLEVERQVDLLLDLVHIVVLYVSAILPQVNRDPVAAGLLHHFSRPER